MIDIKNDVICVPTYYAYAIIVLCGVLLRFGNVHNSIQLAASKTYVSIYYAFPFSFDILSFSYSSVLNDTFMITIKLNSIKSFIYAMIYSNFQKKSRRENTIYIEFSSNKSFREFLQEQISIKLIEEVANGNLKQ